MTEFSVRAEAAAAVRCVAATYDRLPESSRPEVRWSEVDELLDRALADDVDLDHALAAIETWRDLHLAHFKAAAR